MEGAIYEVETGEVIFWDKTEGYNDILWCCFQFLYFVVFLLRYFYHCFLPLPQAEASIPPHESNHMSEIAIEYTSALEREKELGRRYDELFGFMQNHVKGSQVRWGEGGRGGREGGRGRGGLCLCLEPRRVCCVITSRVGRYFKM